MERIVETLVWAYVNTRGNSIYIHNFGMVKKSYKPAKIAQSMEYELYSN